MRSTNESRALTLPARNGALIEPGKEAPLPVRLVEAVRLARAQARAPNTRRAYDQAWARFQDWCDANQRQALPAQPDTIAAWLMAMVEAKAGKPPARATLDQALAAIVAKHRAEDCPFDRKDPEIAETWRFLARELAKRRTPRKASPLSNEDLTHILEALKTDRKADVRDAALLALGWGGALRRSELVGLDWEKLGRGGGFVAVVRDGLSITLATSKGSQAKADEVIIPKDDMPEATEALLAWVTVADLQPGAPVFRRIAKGQKIQTERLTAGSVALIIKWRVRAFARANGRSKVAAAELAAAFSGHSLRRGYGTAAAKEDVPGYRIKNHMRHKSMDTTVGYIEAGEAWSKSGLKGIFKQRPNPSSTDANAPAAPDGSTEL